MADLVEYVIDGILKREQMQKQVKQKQVKQQQQANSTKPSPGAAPFAKSFKANYASLHSVGTQAPVPIKERDEALWKVSRQLEAVFVQQMMSEMRKTVNKSGFMPSGYAEDVHASMMDDAIAQASVKRSNFGIADSIYRQLETASNYRNGTASGSLSKSEQIASVQEISNTADSLKMSSSLAMEVRKHAN